MRATHLRQGYGEAGIDGQTERSQCAGANQSKLSEFNPPSDGFAVANALTAAKSNHIVNMLPSSKRLCRNRSPFFL